ncbi:MAG: hypothetical protein KatS3mg005_0773 [Bryobacteraceae bacterium]|nr:MAG: hypothetical protein KatS3mg005_0773 [Bryobacteraceae bacterium]
MFITDYLVCATLDLVTSRNYGQCRKRPSKIKAEPQRDYPLARFSSDLQ